MEALESKRPKRIVAWDEFFAKRQYRVRFFEYVRKFKTANARTSLFAWTVKKDEDGKFYAFHLRCDGTLRRQQDRLRIVREVGFAKKWKAKDRAYKWFCGATGKPFVSLHNHALKGKNVFERVYICLKNRSLEKYFDIGVEYFGQKIGKYKLCVEDRFGERQVVPVDFFEVKRSD
jgi:hypothetical protein